MSEYDNPEFKELMFAAEKLYGDLDAYIWMAIWNAWNGNDTEHDAVVLSDNNINVTEIGLMIYD